MKPKFPLTQSFDQLPRELPIYLIENALLPGGELPLALSKPSELSMFIDVLRTDQLVGMIQPRDTGTAGDIYKIGCAGRIRQYRERKDGKLNIMLSGICRFEVIEELTETKGYRKALVDWSAYRHDYFPSDIDAHKIDSFKKSLRTFFTNYRMKVDWDTLDKLDPEELVSNLVLVSNFSIELKQKLVESVDLETRLELFTSLLAEKPAPIWADETQSKVVN